MAYETEHPASWRSLPGKDQLAILTLSRVADFFQITSFQAVCYYQLKSFIPSEGEETLSWQTGVALASFTASQSFTAIIWGYLADSRWGGRKTVLLVGLLGTGVSCIGLAFATSFVGVIVCRMLAGALNGTVGAARTMMAEVIGSRKHQARAFLLLPISFSIATVLGPVSAGWLSIPNITDRSVWLKNHPYALPALSSALLLFSTSGLVIFWLHETLRGFDRRLSISTQVHKHLSKNFPRVRGRTSSIQYETVESEELQRNMELDSDEMKDPKSKIPFHRIWSSNVLITFLSQSFLEFHLGAFDSLWPLLLSGPQDTVAAKDLDARRCRGGLGMQPHEIGSAMAITGMIGLSLQLLLYPKIHAWLGPLRCYRVFSLLFPLAYFTSPFLLKIGGGSSGEPDPRPWAAITIILFTHATGRIFCIPASITLLNNCAPHPSVLGTINGLGQALSSAFRTIGPLCAGYLFGLGYKGCLMGIGWWTIAGLAFIGWLTSLFVVEGRGNEIVLPDQSIDERRV